MKKEREDSRDALLRATVRVVAQRGMRGLTYRAVAQEAGVAHGLVAHHFGSIDALVSAALQEAARGAEARNQLGPGTGNIDDVGKSLADIVTDASDEERFQYEMLLEGLRRPELRSDVQDLYRGYINALEAELRIAGVAESDVLARVVFAALDGLVTLQLLYEDTEKTEQALQRLRSLIKGDLVRVQLRNFLADPPA